MDESFLGETRGGDADVPPLASRRSFGTEEGGSGGGASVYLSDFEEGDSGETPTASLEADDDDDAVAIGTPRASPYATTVARRGSRKLTQYLSWQRSVAVRDPSSPSSRARPTAATASSPRRSVSLAWALWITLLTLTYVALLEPIFVAFDAPIRVRPPWRWSALVDAVGGSPSSWTSSSPFEPRASPAPCARTQASLPPLGHRPRVRVAPEPSSSTRSRSFPSRTRWLSPPSPSTTTPFADAARTASRRSRVAARFAPPSPPPPRAASQTSLRHHRRWRRGDALPRDGGFPPGALRVPDAVRVVLRHQLHGVRPRLRRPRPGFRTQLGRRACPTIWIPRTPTRARCTSRRCTSPRPRRARWDTGDVHATTHVERVAAAACVTFAATYYAFLVGSVVGVIERYGAAANRRAAFRDKMVHLRSFLRRHPVPRETRARLAAYFSDAWLRGLRRVDDDAILEQLPAHLRHEVRYRVLEPALRRAFVAPGRDPGERALRATAERLVKRASARGATFGETAFGLVAEGEVLATFMAPSPKNKTTPRVRTRRRRRRERRRRRRFAGTTRRRISARRRSGSTRRRGSSSTPSQSPRA